MEKLTGLGSLRSTLLLRSNRSTRDSEVQQKLSEHFFRRLKVVVGSTPVVKDIGPSPELNKEEHYREGSTRTSQAMIDAVLPTMGSASVSHVDLHAFLKSHSLEHMRANVSAQAEKLQQEMNKLSSGNERLEEKG